MVRSSSASRPMSGSILPLSRFIDQIDGERFQRDHPPCRLAFFILIFIWRCFVLFFGGILETPWDT